MNGVSVAAGALELNGGAIRSESTNENVDTGLGGHAITDDSSHKVDGSIAVAAIVTAVRIATRPTGGRAYFRTGERIRVEVRFGKPVSASSIVRPASGALHRRRDAPGERRRLVGLQRVSDL